MAKLGFLNKVSKVHILLVAFLGFGVYMTFFSEHNYEETTKYAKEIKVLQAKIKETKDSAATYQVKLNALNSNPEMVEKVVREEYHFKKENEDFYITKEK